MWECYVLIIFLIEKYFSQSEKLIDYYEEIYSNIVTFEFFLPLNNESALMSTLDELFYKDTIKKMISLEKRDELYNAFPLLSDETDEDYFERLCQWLSSIFGGYSIGTVNGRFRASEIKTYREVSEILTSGRNYIIDETTAIVRFIFPIGNPVKNKTVDYTYKQNQQKTLKNTDESLNKEYMKIRYFLKILFVKSILSLVAGEDEIWMIERGLNGKSKLYVWKTKILLL